MSRYMSLRAYVLILSLQWVIADFIPSQSQDSELYLLTITKVSGPSLPSLLSINSINLAQFIYNLRVDPLKMLANPYLYIKLESSTTKQTTQNNRTIITHEIVQDNNPKQTKNQLNHTFNLSDDKKQGNSGRSISTMFVENRKIVSMEFRGIGLYHEVPLNFFKGEIYRFWGKITDYNVFANSIRSAPTGYNYLNVVFNGINTPSEIKCYSEIQRPDSQFDISCVITTEGKYYLSIFAGLMGQSSSIPRNIYRNSNFSKGNSKKVAVPKNVRLEITQNNLYAVWDSRAAITSLTFSQGELKNQFVLSNYHNKFKIPFYRFSDYENGEVELVVAHATSSDGTQYSRTSDNGEFVTLSFNACDHKFAQVNGAYVNLTNQLPWKVLGSETIVITGIFAMDISSQIFVVDPFLSISKLYISNSTRIQAGTPLSFRLSFEKYGTNLLQINAITGMALVNRPIYVGNAYPLIPDFMDLKIQSYADNTSSVQVLQNYVSKQVLKKFVNQPSQSAPNQIKRQYLLTLLNGLRSKLGVNQIYLDTQLSRLAQIHSDDMSARGYFSHTNTAGEGPGERAKKLQIQNSIGENIAQSTTLTEAHLSLERSASHLENSLSGLWTRVGIGISSKQDGNKLVVYQFSTRDLRVSPLSQQELKGFQERLVKLVQRRNAGIKQENPKLSEDIGEWLRSVRRQDFYDYLVDRNYRTAMSWSSFKVNYSPNWFDQIEANQSFLLTMGRYTQVGLSIAIDQTNQANMECFAVFL